MKNIFAVFTRELRSYFTSPIAYVIFTVFLGLSGFFFYAILSRYVQYAFQIMQQAQMYQYAPPVMNINDMMLRGLFHNMAIISVFIVPLITMRLISEEKKEGTLELLETSPILPIHWILGKYFASYVLFIVMFIPSFILMSLLFVFGNPEFLPIVAGYMGMFLMGGAFLSIGILISSFTENQIIAGAISFFVFLLLWVIDWMGSAGSGIMNQVLSYLSMVDHFDNIVKGVIDSKDIIFFLSFIFFGIYLTYRSVESIRWRV